MKLQLHPLINKDSIHYQANDRKPAIEELEEVLSIREMIGFTLGNIFKYEYRLEEKGQMKDDLIKIKTYTAYLDELYNLLVLGIEDRISVHRAWDIANKQWRYS